MWTSVLVEELVVEAQLPRAGADVAQRRLRRLLHHVAELAGQRQLRPSWTFSSVTSTETMSPPNSV